jgi:hypothetical protein
MAGTSVVLRTGQSGGTGEAAGDWALANARLRATRSDGEGEAGREHAATGDVLKAATHDEATKSNQASEHLAGIQFPKHATKLIGTTFLFFILQN